MARISTIDCPADGSASAQPEPLGPAGRFTDATAISSEGEEQPPRGAIPAVTLPGGFVPGGLAAADHHSQVGTAATS